MAELDLNLVRHTLETARKHGFGEVELAIGADHFSAILDAKPRPKTQQPDLPAEEPELPTEIEVKAGLVGYFRASKTPLEIGMEVFQGEVIGIIAALGIANDVESPATGKVVEILVEQNQPVEFGQVLARIKP